MLPEPDAEQVPPPVPPQLQEPVSPAGRVSWTRAPVTVAGPLLLAVIVYVTAPPGATEGTPSVLVIARSFGSAGRTVSESVAVLLFGSVSATPPGAATVAVFVSVPVAAALTVGVTGEGT